MRENQTLRRFWQLVLASAISLAMVAAFVLVGGVAPATAAGHGHANGKTDPASQHVAASGSHSSGAAQQVGQAAPANANVSSDGSSGSGPGKSSCAQPGDNQRPGWGYGDNNHTHTGPPGIVCVVTTTTSTTTTTTGTTTSTTTTGTTTTGTTTTGTTTTGTTTTGTTTTGTTTTGTTVANR